MEKLLEVLDCDFSAEDARRVRESLQASDTQTQNLLDTVLNVVLGEGSREDIMSFATGFSQGLAEGESAAKVISDRVSEIFRNRTAASTPVDPPTSKPAETPEPVTPPSTPVGALPTETRRSTRPAYPQRVEESQSEDTRNLWSTTLVNVAVPLISDLVAKYLSKPKPVIPPTEVNPNWLPRVLREDDGPLIREKQTPYGNVPTEQARLVRQPRVTDTHHSGCQCRDCDNIGIRVSPNDVPQNQPFVTYSKGDSNRPCLSGLGRSGINPNRQSQFTTPVGRANCDRLGLDDFDCSPNPTRQSQPCITSFGSNSPSYEFIKPGRFCPILGELDEFGAALRPECPSPNACATGRPGCLSALGMTCNCEVTERPFAAGGRSSLFGSMQAPPPNPELVALARQLDSVTEELLELRQSIKAMLLRNNDLF